MTRQDRQKVYVAMSGGVDSSVAAALLKKRGFKVVGVFMKPWQPEGVECLWQKDREDALRVASKLEIPLLTWDFSKEYKKSVTKYMLREYRAGRTPNPDVMCNKEIKFGIFLKKALAQGADYIATGHYVRKVESRKQKVARGGKSDNLTTYYSLLTANDTNKDQSYFLWTLTQKELKHCLFPIGDYEKPEVRKLANKFGLSIAEKKDSQGVCFIGPLDMDDFLKKYIKPKPGKVVDMDGKTIGKHDGVYYYTIGQRHGLDLGGRNSEKDTRPYFVVSKDLNKNIIQVGSEKDLLQTKTKITDINWLGKKPPLPFELEVKIRYRSASEKGKLYSNGDLLFKNPVRAITSGQSAVFYIGDELIGGGIIK